MSSSGRSRTRRRSSAGACVAAIRRYIETMMPPLAAAMMRFTQEHAYSWHTPGHAGGTAFLKSPVGRVFFDYYGENLLRSDLSISVGSLGSLLDHSGPMGEHERYAARVFGAHRTYSVTNGTSMSNRVIFMAAVGRDQIALCDRNCHKSIEHSLVMTGGIPNYLVPLRNRYGIIGPIPPARLGKEAIKAVDQDQSAGHEGHRQAGGLLGRHELHLRRALLQRETRAGAARSERRSHPFRRSLVCVRALQSALSRSARDAWRSQGSQGSDDLRHALHAQAAGRAVAGVVPAHSRRPRRHSAFALQRIFHDAGVDLAAVSHHRLERRHGRHDGRAGRPHAHQRNDRRSRGVPADRGPRPPAVRAERRVVLQDLERGDRQGDPARRSGKKVRFEDARRSNSPPIRNAGCCIPARPGTASAIWKTTTACSIRSSVDRDAGSRGQGRPRQARHTRHARDAVSALSRRRSRKDHRLHHPGPVLDGHHQGKWGTLLNALLEFKRDYDRNAPLAEVLPELAADSSGVSTAGSDCASSPIRCSRSCAIRGRPIGWRRRFRRCPRSS